MKIYVDADACPVVIKDILFRAAERRQIQTILVANFISALTVSSGFDEADNEIVRRCEAGDLVITADIPLAADVLAKGGHALNPRGELYSTETIKQKLTMRDFMDTLRGSGVHTGGPPPLNQSDRQAFANQLDTLLQRHQSR
jgi:uncharacterized protein